MLVYSALLYLCPVFNSWPWFFSDLHKYIITAVITVYIITAPSYVTIAIFSVSFCKKRILRSSAFVKSYTTQGQTVRSSSKKTSDALHF